MMSRLWLDMMLWMRSVLVHKLLKLIRRLATQLVHWGGFLPSHLQGEGRWSNRREIGR